jgi:hypothetical protein
MEDAFWNVGRLVTIRASLSSQAPNTLILEWEGINALDVSLPAAS